MTNRLRWHALGVALLMLAGSAAGTWGRPRLHLTDQIGQPNLQTLFPSAFGPWRIATNQPIVPDISIAAVICTVPLRISLCMIVSISLMWRILRWRRVLYRYGKPIGFSVLTL